MSRARTFAGAVAALSAVVLTTLAITVANHPAAGSPDGRVQRWVADGHAEAVRRSFEAITRLGSVSVLVPIALVVAVGFLVGRRDASPGAFVVAALGATVASYHLLKPWLERPRPPGADASGWAFPSGHAAAATATFGMLAFLAARGRSRRTRALVWIVAAVPIALVAASRVVLGVHWLTDVLGGIALGSLWISSLALLMTRPEAEEPI